MPSYQTSSSLVTSSHSLIMLPTTFTFPYLTQDSLTSLINLMASFPSSTRLGLFSDIFDPLYLGVSFLSCFLFFIHHSRLLYFLFQCPYLSNLPTNTRSLSCQDPTPLSTAALPHPVQVEVHLPISRPLKCPLTRGQCKPSRITFSSPSMAGSRSPVSSYDDFECNSLISGSSSKFFLWDSIRRVVRLSGLLTTP